MRSPVRDFLRIAAALTLLAGVPVLHAQSVIHFTLPAQSLADSLRAVGTQTNTSVVFDPSLVEGHQAPAIDAQLSLDQALSKLLIGSGLTHQFINERTVVLGTVGSKNAAAMSDAGAPVESSADISETMHLRLAQSEAKPVAAKADVSPELAENKVQEIVVTAQKKRERIQDVPTSMVALSADQLEKQGLTRLADYAKVTPGLVLIGAAGPGAGQGAGQVVLRGISSGTDRNALVGLYLDDVPFTSSSPRFQTVSANLDPALADIDRIEVLKGPQSTLYGASAMGGLIKFISKKPNLEQFEGSMLASGSKTDEGGSGYSARLSLNAPLVTDKVAVRGSVFYRQDPSYVENLANGEDNSAIVKGVRVSLLTQLTDTLETTFSGFLQKTTNNALSNVFRGTLVTQAATPAQLLLTTPALGRFAITSPVDEENEVKIDMVSNYTAWTLPFGTLSNTASFGKLTAVDVYDVSNTASTLAGPANASVLVYGISHLTRSTRRYNDELRLASNPGRFEWVAGLFYTDEKVLYDHVFNGLDAAGNLLPVTAPARTVDTFHTRGDYEEKAAFGNVTYHFTGWLDATVGARYTTNDQSFVTNVVSLSAARNFNVGHPASDSSKDYLATMSFKPRSNLTLYARAASAYRPGGPNSLTQTNEALALQAGAGLDFKADHLWNYEVGIKGSAMNGMLAYSAAAYYMDWDDLQVQVVVLIPTPGAPASANAPAGFTGLGATGNAGTAKSQGVEAELHLRPLDGLSLGVNASYNQAQLTSPTPGLGVDGDALPYTPKWSAAALVDYSKELSNGVTANTGLTYAYTASRFSGFPSATLLELPSYDTLDVRAGMDWSQYSLIARVDNVLNEDALQSVTIGNFAGPYRNGQPVGVYFRPRTYSLQLQVKF